MKRFLIAFFIVLLVPFCVFAQDNQDEYYSRLSSYDFSFFESSLDEETKSFLKDLGVNNFDYESLSKLDFEGVFNIVIGLFKSKMQAPIRSSLLVLSFVILSAFFQSFKISDNEELSSLYSTSSALIISTILLVKLSDTIVISTSSVAIASNFIFAFVPIFCAIVVADGGATTAFATNTMLLSLSQGLSFIASNLFMPIINCFLAIGICSSLRAELRLDRVLSSIKRIITTLISFLSACFVSILSVKTAVASRADAIGLRSIRFAINSVVPVIGSAISEGLLSIQSYSSLIKSSVGVVGIIAVVLVFLPAIIEVVVWRLSLSVCSLVSDAFGDRSVSQCLKAFVDSLLLINVVLILSMVTTVISIGILIAARTG